jgi:signal transduction histidine kinase
VNLRLIEPVDVATRQRPALCLLVAPVATVVAAVGVAQLDTVDARSLVLLALVVVWCASAVFVGVRRRDEPIAPLMLTIAGLTALGLLARADHPLGVGVAVAVTASCTLHLLAALRPGPLPSTTRTIVIAAHVVALGVGLLCGVLGQDGDHIVLVGWWAVMLGIGGRVANVNYRAATAAVRRRMQWTGWSIAVVVEVGLVVVALRLMAHWPPHPGDVALAATAVVPLAFVAASHDRMIARVDRLLTATVSVAGLTALVIAAYGAVVLALGRRLHDGERSLLLLLSMVAATLAATAYLPLRTRLADAANQLVYGERIAPDEALRTWGSRLTRAIPLDELLLQLTESLRKSMGLAAAEVYTGSQGVYELAAGVPHRTVEPLRVPDKDRAVVARAGVSGGTWLDVWLPALAGAAGITRVAPIAHGGELLGMVVVTRPTGANPFSDEDDRVLTELARQVGLALHNVQLDSALQASLEELQRANRDLQDSRRRIVTAGDAERRKLERNLHDGAQQHLVAMAVKLRIAEDLIDDEPGEAMGVIAELRSDLKDAIAELRALAHGIYPPLLSSGGLAEALPNAASRAALPTTVDVADVGRFDADVEATIYFCCLEAMQNAGKHAGDDASIDVRVWRDDQGLQFEVVDDGAGFVVGPYGAAGHGFVNMADRLGTIGGTLAVTSSPGAGTRIAGLVPMA